MTDVVVLGQIGRDLVLTMGALPPAGGSAAARERLELLGGKGANQAVALRQLGVAVALVGVVGDDLAGSTVLDQARADGIDLRGVVRRPATPTALLLDLVEDGGRRRLVESVPDGTLLTVEDVSAAAEVVSGCRMLAVQLQQPGAAVRAALDVAPAAAVVVADGAPADDETRRALLARADVLRADRTEVSLLLGRQPDGVAELRRAAAELLAAGPRLVFLDAGEAGNLAAWRAGPGLGAGADSGQGWGDGELLVPLLGGPAVDPTGAATRRWRRWRRRCSAGPTRGRPRGRPPPRRR